MQRIAFVKYQVLKPVDLLAFVNVERLFSEKRDCSCSVERISSISEQQCCFGVIKFYGMRLV